MSKSQDVAGTGASDDRMCVVNENVTLKLSPERIKELKYTWLTGSPVCYLVLTRKSLQHPTGAASGRPPEHHAKA